MEKAAKYVSEKVSSVAEKVGLHHATSTERLTTMTGCPVANNKNSLTAGIHGPILLQDRFLLEKLEHFDREKTPPRNVHALGYGAYGQFVVTNDITQYSSARLFSQVGKKTDLFVRMSGVFTEQGEADTIRDPRGFAIKFYTEEGNWDLLGINTPVFNVRDAKLGPDAVHAFKRDPRTGFRNPTQIWDYVANHPESLHQTLMIFSDRDGTPMSFRKMHGYGCNTFSFMNSNKQRFWVKFHMISQQGVAGFTQQEAKMVCGEDPNFLGRDLREAIEKKNYPKWKLCCQVMPEADGYLKPWAFDATKIWKHSDYPLIEIGEIELNRNPVDHFAEVEQVAFSPANVVPGIGFSPDKLLQGRLLIYDDTQHHRLGPNFKQLYINTPHGHKLEYSNCYLGGYGQQEVRNKFPHYWPSSFGGSQPDPKFTELPYRCDGPADYYDYPNEGTDEDYYLQPREFLEVLDSQQKQNLVENIAYSLWLCPETVINATLTHLQKIDQQFGFKVEKIVRSKLSGALPKTPAETLVDRLNTEVIHS